MDIITKLSHSSNYGASRTTSKIKYIVIHYTANKGDTAAGNASYFSRTVVGASAHFFVDETSIYNSVPVTKVAWHCGGGLQGSGSHPYYKICTNTNSIGVEICMNDKSGAIRMGSITHAAAFVKELMATYNVPIENIIRHYDVTCKRCPLPMITDTSLWEQFKAMLVETPVEEDDEVVKQLKVLDKQTGNIVTVEAIEKNNTNYVKLRDLEKFSDAKVDYDGQKKLPSIDLARAGKKVNVNFCGKVIAVDGVAQNDYNYIGIRNLFEQLGYTVGWDQATQMVTITM